MAPAPSAPPDIPSSDSRSPDIWLDILGLDLPPDHQTALWAAYQDIRTALVALRQLDLTTVPPLTVFDPTLAYRPGDKP